MKKQAQFITYNAAVSLSLSLVLLNQLAAQAGTASDKTTWLTQNLSQSKQSKTKQPLVILKALPAQEDSRQKPQSIIVNCSNDSSHTIKLRPFMANRKLPSRRDLELALIEQKATLAEESKARLNGQVSEFAVGNNDNNQDPAPQNTWVDIPEKTHRLSNGNVTRRNFIKQAAAGASQSNFSFMKQAEQHLVSSVTPQISESNMPSGPVAPNMPTNMLSGAGPTVPVTTAPQTYAPPMEAFLPSTVNQPSGFPSNFNNQPTFDNQKTISGFGSAGPPPFPLNLVPEATLKQLIRSLASGRTSQAGSTSRSSFGSWRGSSSNLTYGGFQSHLSPRYQAMASRPLTYHICALPAVTAAPIRSRSHSERTQNVSNQKDTAARNRMLLESQVRVAAYPAYTTQSLRAWNFAQ